ncbi:Glycoside hydrolase, family 9 [Cynara cardunculus var. scolymus]|uniref:Endoglucanase n=1 Tax=Cynara cardunculus var. scolymus TaxID=59895 RepID=A0A103YCR7_CYNCS|nr:Glycoside hydrolase, family 9 [Cynara cardunculus var. scolymus]
MGFSKGPSSFLHVFFLALLLWDHGAQAKQNYKDALAKSILFFQGQRSGRLPTSQKLSWRSISGLSDGSLAHNSKPLGPQLENVRVAIRWGADYLIKCATATPGVLYVGVGDPNTDHKCWERPEDMDTARTVYSVSRNKPGSDVAGETAAALAAASMVFRVVDKKYSKLLLRTAKSVFQFAAQYRGSYSDSLGAAVCPFYCSYSGYKDELLWGAAWLLRATKDVSYRNFINSLGANDATDIFSWDNKLAGARVLLSRGSLVANDKSYEPFKQQAQDFMCRILPNSPYSTTQYTKGGLMFKLSASNLQYVSSITFLLTTYAKYMKSAKTTFNCGNILMSYMVGYGANYPRRIHHRGSSLPSVSTHPQSFGCEGGFQPFYYTSNPNPNILTGAIVGGPNENDFYPDERTDYSHAEPATYINAAIVGPLAYLSGRA